MEEIPFWEETYRTRDINTFPAEPNGTVLEFEHLLKKDPGRSVTLKSMDINNPLKKS